MLVSRRCMRPSLDPQVLLENNHWSTFAWALPYEPHGPVHMYVGGEIECNGRTSLEVRQKTIRGHAARQVGIVGLSGDEKPGTLDLRPQTSTGRMLGDEVADGAVTRNPVVS